MRSSSLKELNLIKATTKHNDCLHSNYTNLFRVLEHLDIRTSGHWAPLGRVVSWLHSNWLPYSYLPLLVWGCEISSYDAAGSGRFLASMCTLCSIECAPLNRSIISLSISPFDWGSSSPIGVQDVEHKERAFSFDTLLNIFCTHQTMRDHQFCNVVILV